jgi:hypothetical protein
VNYQKQKKRSKEKEKFQRRVAMVGNHKTRLVIQERPEKVS